MRTWAAIMLQGEDGDNGFQHEARSKRRRTEAVELQTACTPAAGRRRGWMRGAGIANAQRTTRGVCDSSARRVNPTALQRGASSLNLRPFNDEQCDSLRAVSRRFQLRSFYEAALHCQARCAMKPPDSFLRGPSTVRRSHSRRRGGELPSSFYTCSAIGRRRQDQKRGEGRHLRGDARSAQKRTALTSPSDGRATRVD